MTDYFDNYFFTSNLTSFVCPGFSSFQCKEPNACARDPNTGKRYCCDSNDVCWTITSNCATDGTTLDCGGGDSTWCCLDKTSVLFLSALCLVVQYAVRRRERTGRRAGKECAYRTGTNERTETR